MRRGLTLVEIIVAIVIGTIVLVAARRMSDTVQASATRLTRLDSTDLDAEGAFSTLRDVMGNLEVRADAATWPHGNGTRFQFASWCHTGAGWLGRCAVSLAMDSASARLTMRGRDVIDSVELPGEFRLLYLAPGASRWMESWPGAATAPAAIGLAGPRDTTIVRVGYGQ